MASLQSITAKNTPAGILNLLRSVSQALAGRVSKGIIGPTVPAELIRGLQLRVGMVALSKIKQSFLVKATGGVGEDGIKWKPLSPATIAQRRSTPAERRSLGITPGMHHRGLLTADQDKRWRQIFASRKAQLMLKFGMGEEAASARAAQIAWTVLKSEGAKTKLTTLGGRNVEILRDSGALLRSFSPGIDGKGDRTILRTPPGEVVVGTNRHAWHHAGVPGRLPSRPFWPIDGKLPQSWWMAIQEALQQGISEIIVRLLQKAA